MLHASLRYLLITRWRNRLRGWLRHLRTWKGALVGLVLATSLTGIVVGGGLGSNMPGSQRAASFAVLLSLMMVMQILTGLGQRGLVFAPADLDFLFPAPLPRRQLLLYQFVTHYVGAAFVGVLFTLFFGGARVPSPALLMVGITLAQIVNAHLYAAAAELSMSIADRAYALLRKLTVVPAIVLSVAALALLVGGLTGLGDVPARLEQATEAPWMRVVFFPAFQAVALGQATGPAEALLPLAGLLACVLGSFGLVLALRVDFVESSFVTSRRVFRARQRMRRGVSDAAVRRSTAGPRSRLFRGAGAVVWLNALTLRRQLRATLGGVVIVLVMLAVLGGRDAARGSGETLLIFLAMIPFWMALPIGFRVPREQLTTLRLLPLPPRRLAAALVAVPVLVPSVLQAAVAITLVALGRVSPSLLLPALVAYVAANATIFAIEGAFALRREQPNAVNVAQAVAQVFLQMLALLPGLVVGATVAVLSRVPAVGVFAGGLAQLVVAGAAITALGKRLEREEGPGGASLQ